MGVLYILAAAAAPTTGTLQRFGALVALLAAIIVVLGFLWNTGRKIGRGIETQISATRANTTAIDALTKRVDQLETHLPT